MTGRRTRTTEIFKAPDRQDGDRSVPAGILKDPTVVPRLSWRHGPRVRADWGSLFRSIEAAPGSVYFCDNSIFDDATPADLWTLLLGAPGRLVITPRVWGELLPWLKRRPGHPAVKAMKLTPSGLRVQDEPKINSPGRRAFDYYTALLMSRRMLLNIGRNVFRKVEARDPDPAEVDLIASDIQRHAGTRGRLIATKAPGALTDEVLILLAVDFAVRTGTPTVVLTRDFDVEEQFFKLLWLIETHYRGMLLADRYIEDFGQFRIRPVPDAILRDPSGPFEPENAVLIERDAFMRSILPAEFQFVPIRCLVVGPYFSELTFGAERGMARLLDVKDATGGKSTTRLQGRNLHASIAPLRGGGTRDYAALVNDRTLPLGLSGARIAKLDLMQALTTGERFGQIRPSSGILVPSQKSIKD